MNRVSTSAAQIKAATSRTRTTKPKPKNCALRINEPFDNENTAAMNLKRYDAIARSKMNRDLWRIRNLAKQLEEMIETFESEHGAKTAETIFEEAGLPAWKEGDDMGHLYWDVENLKDLRGFTWALKFFTSLIEPYGAAFTLPPAFVQQGTRSLRGAE